MGALSFRTLWPVFCLSQAETKPKIRCQDKKRCQLFTSCRIKAVKLKVICLHSPGFPCSHLFPHSKLQVSSVCIYIFNASGDVAAHFQRPESIWTSNGPSPASVHIRYPRWMNPLFTKQAMKLAVDLLTVTLELFFFTTPRLVCGVEVTNMSTSSSQNDYKSKVWNKTFVVKEYIDIKLLIHSCLFTEVWLYTIIYNKCS